jgi:flagellar hook-basal body complex protein FliE
MVPITQTALSLFGASLGVPPAPSTPASAAVATGEVLLSGANLSASLGAAPAPFADLVTEAVGEVQHLEQQASVAIKGLISGRGVDVHEAMIAAQKAGMGFDLVLAVRNKALAAYQQVMGMQF